MHLESQHTYSLKMCSGACEFEQSISLLNFSHVILYTQVLVMNLHMNFKFGAWFGQLGTIPSSHSANERRLRPPRLTLEPEHVKSFKKLLFYFQVKLIFV